jgi:hypothetical protein
MPFLHLPVQSGSDAILKAMNRKHTSDDYRRLIEKLRKARPDIALSSDFIVGFPGETDADFDAIFDRRAVRVAERRPTLFPLDDAATSVSPRPATAASKRSTPAVVGWRPLEEASFFTPRVFYGPSGSGKSTTRPRAKISGLRQRGLVFKISAAMTSRQFPLRPTKMILSNSFIPFLPTRPSP